MSQLLLAYVKCKDTRLAILLAEELWNDGIIAYVPNLAATQNLVTPRTPEEWAVTHDEFLNRCDVLLLINGTAPADCTIPVFTNSNDLIAFKAAG